MSVITMYLLFLQKVLVQIKPLIKFTNCKYYCHLFIYHKQSSDHPLDGVILIK